VTLHLLHLHLRLTPHRLALLLAFIFVVGLLIGIIAAVRLIGPLVGRVTIHEALASYLAYRQADDVHAEAFARMASVVQAARQPGTAQRVSSSYQDDPARRRR
jgi:Na+-transporting methylmalonyl-CoA/oxaloacetate decarboxylase gamma subunit